MAGTTKRHFNRTTKHRLTTCPATRGKLYLLPDLGQPQNFCILFAATEARLGLVSYSPQVRTKCGFSPELAI